MAQKKIPFYPSPLPSATLAVWLTLLLIGTSRCARQPDIDKSLLTDEPCAAPCWQNIIPGQSNKDDVRKALENNPYVKPASVEQDHTTFNGIDLAYYVWPGRGKLPNRIELHADRVLRIILHPDYPLTLGDVVDKFGPPENIYARYPPGDTAQYLVHLDYPALGMSFHSFFRPAGLKDVVVGGGYGVLSKDLLVTEVNYFAPTSLEQMYHNVYLYSDERVEYYMASKKEWSGFGRIQVMQ